MLINTQFPNLLHSYYFPSFTCRIINDFENEVQTTNKILKKMKNYV